jgi:hypothetical protein
MDFINGFKQFETPVYGEENEHTNSFVVPGAAITFLSFLASLTCGLAFIIEKNDGMLTRGIVAGVTHVEIMLSHLSIHFVVLLIQSLFAFLVMFLAFDIPQLGSNGLAYAIVVLNGVTGMSLGKSPSLYFIFWGNNLMLSQFKQDLSPPQFVTKSETQCWLRLGP